MYSSSPVTMTKSSPEQLQGLRTGINQDELEHPLRVVRLAGYSFPGGGVGGKGKGRIAMGLLHCLF